MPIAIFVLALALPVLAQDPSWVSAIEALGEQVKENDDRFELFNECLPMRLDLSVQTEDASGGLELTEAQVQVTVESRLRSARLYRQPPDIQNEEQLYQNALNLASLLANNHLHVNIHVVGLAFSNVVEFRKRVNDETTGNSRYAATWERRTLGTHANKGGYILSGTGLANRRISSGIPASERKRLRRSRRVGG